MEKFLISSVLPLSILNNQSDAIKLPSISPDFMRPRKNHRSKFYPGNVTFQWSGLIKGYNGFSQGDKNQSKETSRHLPCGSLLVIDAFLWQTVPRVIRIGRFIR